MRQRLQGFLLVCLLLVSAQTFAQQRAVSGQVLDEEGMPIPGVSVYEKDTSNGTTTDFEGEYTLNVAGDDAVIVFSYVGFQTQEVQVGNQNTISVTLSSDVQALEEVVVVGYGVQRRANLTGAVSTVDTEVLESRPITDVARGLQGTTPGLTITTPTGNIGSSPQIKLRGNIGTLGTEGGAEPLILVDNVEVSNLNMVNPQDIESISVLKDAASTSIYGARAAWGVVLITTKKGSRSSAPTVSYSNNFSWATPSNVPEMASAADGAEAMLAAFHRFNPSEPAFGSLGVSVDQEAIDRMREWEQSYGGQNLGDELQYERDFEIRDGRLFFYRPWNAYDMFVREWTPQQKHDISVAGGSENTNYYLGLGYLGQEGVLNINTDQYNRYNVNLGVSTNITDWLEVNGNILYSSSELKAPYNSNGSWHYLTRWAAHHPYGTYNGVPFRNSVTEIQQAQMNSEKDKLTRINLGATITPIEDFVIDLDYTNSGTDDHNHIVASPTTAYSHWAGYTSLDEMVPSVYNPTTNFVEYQSAWSNKHTAKAVATYSLDLEDHSFKFMAGGDLEQYEYWYHRSRRNDLMDPTNGEIPLATGDEFVFLNAGESRNKWSTLGAFGRINYSFKDKLLIEINGRYDGSSRLSADKKWAFFPSFSAGYVLSEEDYMEFAKPTLSFLKLRGSWGELGTPNSRIANIYRVMGSSNSGWYMNGTNMLTVSTPGALPHGLTWETVATLDFGLDARFFQNRLGLTFDWYERTVSDMHSPGITLPATFGTSSPIRNFGEMKTTGWELAIDFRHSFENGLNLNAAVTLSDFKEKITKYANSTKNIYTNYEGKNLGDIWGYETDRFFTEDDFNSEGTPVEGIADQSLFENGSFIFQPGDIKFKDLNGDGVIDYGANTVDDHGDLKVIGNTTPRYQYSIQFGADWKGFDLNVFMQGVGKRDVWGLGPVTQWGYRALDGLYAHQMDYWTPENPDAFYPRPTDMDGANNVYNFQPQSKYLLDMSYLRMKNITFGYSFPVDLIEEIGVSRFRIYFSGENLFEIDNLNVPLDPEVDFYGTDYNFGRAYPFSRSVSFGVQVSI